MAIRDRVRRALRKSEASDTISQTESNTTAGTSSQSSEGPQLEKTTSRLARVFTFGSADSPEKEKERAEKRERKAQDKASRRSGARTHPRDRPLTTQNIRHQEMLSHFSMTFGASDPDQIETMSFMGVSPCCTRPGSRRGSFDLDPMSHGSTTSFSNSSSETDSSRDE
ncbi:hypothetical protein PWT90_09520 [Aphanocladium album]|nr:hypothetical protein PWT90_09520 [Aphanocladium album]